MKVFALSLLLGLTFATVSAQEPATVAEVIATNDDFSTLETALETAGLTETLSGNGPFTVFAPTNEAFAALPAGELDRLLANPGELKQVLSYHVVPERLLEQNFGEFIDDSAAPFRPDTLEGSTLSIDVEEDTDPTIIINDVAGVTQTDITAGNGVVHVIGAVLLPGVTADGTEDTMSGSSGGNMSGGAMSGGGN